MKEDMTPELKEEINMFTKLMYPENQEEENISLKFALKQIIKEKSKL